MVNKKRLSEADIRTKYITPAIQKAGWDIQTQFREEVTFTDGKILVKGKLTARGKQKRADYILYYKPNIPIAIVEAKDNTYPVGGGMQQALEYAEMLDIPFVFSSNGDGFVFHDKTVQEGKMESFLNNDNFPTPKNLWNKYKVYKGIKTSQEEKIVEQDYYSDGKKSPRYYQQNAINRTVEAIAKGENRILLVMATGTGKTYTAFQIIYRLWKSRTKKRILFLADRNALIDQTIKGDFKYFKNNKILTWVKQRKIDKSYEVYFALYQGISGSTEDANAYKQFSRDFFDLVVIDECHRGSAKEDSAWREILNYFQNATHIGLTATPKETNKVSNIEYFGEPIYTYSLKQGIDDGFLSPYKVIRVNLDVDVNGWRPEKGKTDKFGNEIEDRIYNRSDFDRNLVIEERTEIVAKKLTEFMKNSDRYAKTIVFCTDIDHAERMRQALVNENSDLVAKNHKYVMRITGDNQEGKNELDNFIAPEERYPIIATTSELMTTGIDAQTCKIIVLDAEIKSMTKFKQIIGRGTRVNEEFDKKYFTIIDFRNVTNLFADPEFDGEPVVVKTTKENDPIVEPERDNTDDDFDIIPPDVTMPTIIDVEPQRKIYVNNVDVSILMSREINFDKDGKMITVSLKDYTKEIIKEKYASLDDFLNKWKNTDKKETIIKELEEQGVLIDDLLDTVNREVDLFDLICHIAYDQPPLTRKERANNVKKRNYFTKYGEQARKVLESLLEKYADEGVLNIEKMTILTVKPLTDFGSPMEIISLFGSKKKYLEAIQELENQLYA